MPSENKDRKYYLVRTNRDLAEKSIIGIGWSDFNFSNYSDTEKLIKDIDNLYGIGRRGNQIRRFNRIEKDDIIIVPLPWCVAIGIAKEGLFYDKNDYSRDKANQRNVTFEFDKDGNLKTINRTEFSEAFQRRLKVRGMTVNDISEFKSEIDSAITSQNEGKTFSWSNTIQNMLIEKEYDFKEVLFKNIQSGRTNLQSGGIGLEHLVKELLIIEGYDADVLSKRAFNSFADADVKASKEDRFSSDNLLVQVKHHQGISGDWGIKQLEEIKRLSQKDYSDHILIFVTSAEVTTDLRKKAESLSIRVIDGHELADWIYENLNKLNQDIKNKLGICEVPTLTSLYKKC